MMFPLSHIFTILTLSAELLVISKLPNPIMPAPSDGPDMPHVHQGIEHDGAVRDGLLSPDADGVRGRDGDPTLPDVRPVSDPDRVDHVYDGVRGHVYHHG
ncbi:hypothetical protein UCREL1_3777 [Eutypa lata UCREL1]|uniref:Secreted protein n=1 Tax=Eutypa lata (strain UCR-EL1) TaxID=1287681 RepID=M7SY48_EUTLA|nr:hypothetical protein UCREL1_3777 [Eutypa lata UCREL1]